jgi:NHLM bacteriocin system ABC transporter peptidase/ATP-binding protein
MLAAGRRFLEKIFSAARQHLPSFRRARVHTPTVLQMDALECGAASLSMILAYNRKYVPLEELRMVCGVSRNGSKASNLLRAAEHYGLEADGYKVELEGLGELPVPSIILWNFNHFVVLEGADARHYYLNDPGVGKRAVTHDTFDKAFSGVVLCFRRGAGFAPSGTPPSLINGLRKRLAGTGKDLAYLGLVGVALAIPAMVVPAFTSVFIDDILVQGMKTWTVPLVEAMALTALLIGVLSFMQRHYLLRLEGKVSLITSTKFFAHVLRLPIQFYFQRSAGDIGSRVGIADRLAKILSEDLTSGILSLLMAFFYAVIMLFYDVAMSCLTILLAGVNVAVLRLVSERRQQVNKRVSMDYGKVVGTSMNGIVLIETLKASGAESDFFSRWAGYQTKFVNVMQEASASTIYLDMLPHVLMALNTALVLGLGGLRVMNGDMTIGTLIAFQALVLAFVGPINTLVTFGSKLQEFKGDMDRLDDVMLNPCDPGCSAPTASGEQLAVAKLEGALELRNVTFGYSRLDPPLIANFSLSVQPGKRVALVGSSGSGKSTISKLVTGLYAPWEGEILFDGVTRSAWPSQQLINSVAMVDQDISMFSGTIRDNLTMWDTTIPKSAVVQAAKDACIHDIILGRPRGYDGEVTEGGNNFSGGQRQRLEIARALSGNPRLLVLDEATSALDPLTEKIVDSNIRRRGCACVIVAHRLSAVRDCDEIIFMEGGVIAERGTHHELVQLNGRYARLIANE